MLAAIAAYDIHVAGIGITFESTGKAEKVSNILTLLHLVLHRTLHLTCDINDDLVCRNENDIAILKNHVVRCLSVNEEVIYVNRLDILALSDELDATKASEFCETAGPVESMVN